MLKVATILGTRPEIIRLSRVIARLADSLDHVLVHTGQNWDYELNERFFEDLGLPRPDHFLDTGGGTLGETLGKILARSEAVLREVRPDAVLILGDTNSAIAALMARRMQIPVYHMEAGNRCFDLNVPEETNRKLVDHISDFNLVYTEHARRNLLAEGLHPRRIYLTGSPLREVLEHHRAEIDAATALDDLGLAPRGYFLASLHRQENVDAPERLRTLLGALTDLAERHDRPVIVSTHPRTRKRLEALGAETDPRLRFLKPFGFFDYNRLQRDAFCVISDSGSVAEEAAILGFPAITPRDSIERPEALDAGTLIMTGVDRTAMLEGVAAITAACAARAAAGLPHPAPADYGIPDTAARVVHLILGTARVSHRWDGVRPLG